MPAAIDFYFDFSSSYGYFASMKIDDLARRHGRDVNWRPILLGVAFKVTGGEPLLRTPLKGPYIERDIARSARFLGIAYNSPSKYPIAGVAPGRAFYWVNEFHPTLAKKLVRALYHAYFVQDRDISSPEITADVAASVGLKRDEVLAALNDVAVKDKLRQEVAASIKRGVFGSPFIVVDDEPFWGVDRLDQVERWLAYGPF